MWNAGTIPFVILAIIVAAGPVYFMTWHSLKHGHLASAPDHARAEAQSDPRHPMRWAGRTSAQA